MKRVSVVLGLVASAIILILSVAPRAASAPAVTGDPVKGQQVYTAQKCALCHKINGVGGALAGDLTAIATKRDAVWLASYLPNPKTIDPKNPPKIKMTATTAKGQDLADLVAYLMTLKGVKK